MRLRVFLAVYLIGFSFFSESDAAQVPVENISYKAKTNLSAIQVSGKAKSSPLANFELSDGAAGPQTLTRFDVEISPNELDSGLSLRDSHMREKIFQKEDGSLPIIKFKLKDPTSLSSEAKPISALLEIRGKEVAFNPLCSGSIQAAKLKFDCKGSVSLEAYAIPAPSHLGVKVQPDVEIVVATEQDIRK